MGADGQQVLVSQKQDLPPASSITDFEIDRVLGKGTFADVYLGRRIANQQLYAIKVINKKLVIQQNELQHTNGELKILSQLNHPNLIRLHGAFQNADNLYLVLDFMQGGELFHHMQKNRCFPEHVAVFMVAQLVLGLEELHRRKIIMRDLKPENVLLDSAGYLRITDFGLSKLSTDSRSNTAIGTTFCGTAEYLSPEQLRNLPHGVEVDYWALGVIAYELINGQPPFYNSDHKVMFKNILKAEPKFGPQFSPAAQSFIRGCLTKDCRKRLGVGGIKQLKLHQWFAKIDFEKLLAKQYDMEYKPDMHLNKDNVDLSNFDSRFVQQQINIQEVMATTNLEIGDMQKYDFQVDSKVAEQIVAQKLQEAIKARPDELADFIVPEIQPVEPPPEEPKPRTKRTRSKEPQDDDFERNIE